MWWNVSRPTPVFMYLTLVVHMTHGDFTMVINKNAMAGYSLQGDKIHIV